MTWFQCYHPHSQKSYGARTASGVRNTTIQMGTLLTGFCKNWDGGTDADGFCYEAVRRQDAVN